MCFHKIPEQTYFNYSFDNDELNGLGKITGALILAGQKMKMAAIPCFAWAHREMGKMSVSLKSR